MASSSLLRSAVRELRRSIFRPPRLATPLMEGSRLLTTDGAGKKTSPPSSPPNATQFQLRLENPLRSNCADSVETIKKLQVSKDELMAYKRYLLEKKNPRCLSSSSGCGGRTEPDEKIFSMDEFLERKKQFGNNEGTFRDAEISGHERQEEQLLRKRLSSTVKMLSRCLHEQMSLIQEFGVQTENNNKYDQVKYFLVLIPSFVSIGLILDKLHVFG